MLTAKEKHQLLVEFNNTTVDYPKDKTIVDLFEEQAERTPEAIAKLVKLCEARGIIAERLFGEKEILYEKEKSEKLLTINIDL